MLLTILARMPNDEQRLQLLQALRNKISNYNLNWFDIKNATNLFSNQDCMRFKILKFFLSHINNLTNKIDIEDYIDLSNQCTNNNEQLRICLFEQIYDKLNIQNRNDLDHVVSLFQTIDTRQKVEAMIRNSRSDLIVDREEAIDNQSFSSIRLNSNSEPVIATSILLPKSSLFHESSSTAPLKRTYSFDNERQDHSCRQMVLPSLTMQHDEFIQQRNLLSPIIMCSSNSSLSSSSDEHIPIRTYSFMVAIKNTFKRLKET